MADEPAGHGAPQVVLDGLDYPEGPLCSARDGCLYLVEWSGDRVWRVQSGRAEVLWATPPGSGPSGLAQDAAGALWACLYSARQVVRWGPAGEIRWSADGCGGERFKGPNDLVTDGRGGLYVTDSGDFQDDWHSGRPAGAVYYIDPAGQVRRVAERLCFPNGLALTPDGSRLAVAEHRRNRLLVYDVLPGGALAAERVLVQLDDNCLLPYDVAYELGPDGMCWDDQGRLWVAHHGGGKLVALDASGQLLDRLDLPRGARPTNVAFDAARRQLYVTESEVGLLYRVELD